MWLKLIGVAGLVLLASACGSTHHAAPPAQQTGWLAFSGCMRSNGVPHYPDPAAGGAPPKKTVQQLGVSDTEFAAAQSACRHLLPNGGRPASRAVQQRIVANALRYSQCVRAHGVSHFPDPGSDGRIPDPASVGIDQGSPKFEAANTACAADRPPYMPSNAAYNEWARTHR